MHNLLKVIFLVLAALLAQASLADEAVQPACFAYLSASGASCRVDAAVAPVENKFFVWGGRETSASAGCSTCDQLAQGLNSGGLYDQNGRLLEAFPTADGPGPRFDAQALWNRQALFVWGGVRKQELHRLEDGSFAVRRTDVPSVSSFYLPGARRWVRMAVENAPPVAARLELTTDGGVRACWNDTPVNAPAVTLCQAFDMVRNAWGPKGPRA